MDVFNKKTGLYAPATGGGEFDITTLPGVKLALRNDLDVLTTGDVPATTGQIVTKWLDQSGQGNDTTGTGANTPTFEDDYINLPYIASSIEVSEAPAVPFSSGDNNFTILYRMSWGQESAGGFAYYLGSSHSGVTLFLLRTTNTAVRTFSTPIPETSYAENVSPVTALNTYKLIYRASGNIELGFNNDAPTLINPGSRTDWSIRTLLHIGRNASDGARNRIGGFIMCDGILTGQDLIDATNWIEGG